MNSSVVSVCATYTSTANLDPVATTTTSSRSSPVVPAEAVRPINTAATTRWRWWRRPNHPSSLLWLWSGASWLICFSFGPSLPAVQAFSVTTTTTARSHSSSWQRQQPPRQRFSASGTHSTARRRQRQERSSATTTTTSTARKMFLMDCVDGYNYLLTEHPLVTASITAGCLSGLGDVIAQFQHHHQHKADQAAPPSSSLPLAASLVPHQQLQRQRQQDEGESSASSSDGSTCSSSLPQQAYDDGDDYFYLTTSSSSASSHPLHLHHQYLARITMPFTMTMTTIGSSMNTLHKERTLRFVCKGLGGGLIWLAWYHLADALTQWLLYLNLFHTASQAQQQSWDLMTLLMMVGGAAPEGLGGSGPPAGVGGMDNTLLEVASTLSPSALLPTGALVGDDDLSSTVMVAVASVVPPSVMIGRTVLSILLDQFLASPIILAFWEIPVPILLSREEDNGSIPHHITTKVGGLLVENAKVWTVANAIIYNLPLEYRVLASSCADVLWQSILSRHVNSNDALSPSSSLLQEEQEQEPEVVTSPTLASATDCNVGCGTNSNIANDALMAVISTCTSTWQQDLEHDLEVALTTTSPEEDPLMMGTAVEAICLQDMAFVSPSASGMVAGPEL